jgi:glycosyltransferase involved in cell wall biosynthesis
MEDDRPFVSVVIPTHNRSNYLKDLLGSLFRQTYPMDRYEIIVVDNSSRDSTEETVNSLQTEAPCALHYVRKEDEGPGVARNVGIARARGSIIAFTDDDCIVDARWLELGTERFDDCVGLVQGKTLPPPGEVVETFSLKKRVTEENWIYHTCNIFYRKKAIDEAGGFSHFIGLDRFGAPMIGGEDTDLAWKVKKAGWRSAFAENAVVYHHVFPLSPWSVIYNHRKFQLFFDVWPLLLRRHKEMRSLIFWRVFLSRGRALFCIFICGLILGLLAHPGFLLLSAPTMVAMAWDVLRGHSLRMYPRRLYVLGVVLLSAMVDTMLLIGGSVKHRSIVL